MKMLVQWSNTDTAASGNCFRYVAQLFDNDFCRCDGNNRSQQTLVTVKLVFKHERTFKLRALVRTALWCIVLGLTRRRGVLNARWLHQATRLESKTLLRIINQLHNQEVNPNKLNKNTQTALVGVNYILSQIHMTVLSFFSINYF